MGLNVELPEGNQDTTGGPMLSMSELTTVHKMKSLSMESSLTPTLQQMPNLMKSSLVT